MIDLNPTLVLIVQIFGAFIAIAFASIIFAFFALLIVKLAKFIDSKLFKGDDYVDRK